MIKLYPRFGSFHTHYSDIMIVMPKSCQHQLQINYDSRSISALPSNMLTLLLTQKKKKLR